MESVTESAARGVWFSDGRWDREVFVDRRTEPLFGLVELMDNNPLVCADTMSVPSASGTLALIALGPLGTAGLLQEEPTFISNCPVDEEDIGECLATTGWSGGCLVRFEPHPLEGVLVASASAVVTNIGFEEMAELYEERFGHSFFVRSVDGVNWEPSLVRGRPEAHYRLSISEDTDLSLATIRVLADAEGKCGAAQVVHAMNVMCGFEEGLSL
ncbi:MAG TPA: hypothetical protein VG944_11625 [Fimbriimonas sp.]|nr:hypothetical protein [Fimbriimonas sp.]